MKPNTANENLDEVDVFVLYQPTSAFRKIYTYIDNKKASSFTITGPKTDWNFLNRVQADFENSSYGQKEEIFPSANPGFSFFDIEDFNLTDFPPLTGDLGELTFNTEIATVFYQKILGEVQDKPLWAFFGNEEQKKAVLFGENLWKWRMQTFRNSQSFKGFDDFVGKMMLYLATTEPKNRFSVTHQNVFAGSNEARIEATYFDETFVFDANATIVLNLYLEETEVSRTIPMLVKGNYYEADLSGLPAGNYRYEALVENTNYKRSGNFTILDFDVEKQFSATNYDKLAELATKSSAKLYFPSEIDVLMKDLLEDKRFTPTQKSRENIVSLIDFKWLLGVIVLALALEWFIRKYNGLT